MVLNVIVVIGLMMARPSPSWKDLPDPEEKPIKNLGKPRFKSRATLGKFWTISTDIVSAVPKPRRSAVV